MGDAEQFKTIRCLVRVRPPLQRELDRVYKPCLQVDQSNGTVIVLSQPKSQVFQYDHVAWTDTSQEEVFEKVGKPITDMCVDGYNATIFAYGQTGSGKTFTIQGATENTSQVGVPYRSAMGKDGRGLMPRVFRYLFEQIERAEAASGRTVKYLCQASFLEIYNDRVYDLMLATSDVLTVREHADRGVYVEGLVEVPINTVDDALRVLDVGARNRTVGETAMNRESSRSHSVFMLTITSSHMDRESGLTTNRTSHFNLVDLAGSERQRDTNTSGQRLSEASGINQSLSALGNVIVSLVDISHGKQRHIPYRDSKLTFLLKDSLGGNSLTFLVACVSPSADSMGETVSTLKFAQRAKRIKNRAVLNETVGGTLDALKRENARLKSALKALQDQVGLGGDALSGMIAKITSQSEAEMRAMQVGGLLSAESGATDAVTSFDMELFRQSLKREQDLHEQLDRVRLELDNMKQLNDRLEKQRQSTRMILSFREKSIEQLQNQLVRLRKKETTPLAEHEVALMKEITRLQEEIKELNDQIAHHPDVLAQGLRLSTLELQVKELSDELEEWEELQEQAAIEAEKVNEHKKDEVAAAANVPKPVGLGMAAPAGKAPIPAGTSPDNTAAATQKVEANLAPALRVRSRLLKRMQALLDSNFKMSQEIVALRASGHTTTADTKQVFEILDGERQAIAERLAQVEKTLEDERKRAQEDLIKVSKELERERDPSEQARQLNEYRNLSRNLKSFLEKAVEREQNEKQKVQELTTELEDVRQEHDREVHELQRKERELQDTVQTLTTMLIKQETQISQLSASSSASANNHRRRSSRGSGGGNRATMAGTNSSTHARVQRSFSTLETEALRDQFAREHDDADDSNYSDSDTTSSWSDERKPVRSGGRGLGLRTKGNSHREDTGTAATTQDAAASGPPSRERSDDEQTRRRRQQQSAGLAASGAQHNQSQRAGVVPLNLDEVDAYSGTSITVESPANDSDGVPRRRGAGVPAIESTTVAAPSLLRVQSDKTLITTGKGPSSNSSSASESPRTSPHEASPEPSPSSKHKTATASASTTTGRPSPTPPLNRRASGLKPPSAVDSSVLSPFAGLTGFGVPASSPTPGLSAGTSPAASVSSPLPSASPVRTAGKGSSSHANPPTTNTNTNNHTTTTPTVTASTPVRPTASVSAGNTPAPSPPAATAPKGSPFGTSPVDCIRLTSAAAKAAGFPGTDTIKSTGSGRK